MNTMLAPLLDRLNLAIDRHNAEIGQAVEEGRLDADEAAQWRLPAGVVTADLVKAGPSRWSTSLRRAVRSIHARESPDEIVRMCDACSAPTETVKHLRMGAVRSIGYKPGPLHGFPVAIRVMDLAHLIANSGAGKAILLG